MADKISPDEMHKMLFMHLVMMLSSSAMQQLGKLQNPVTGKTETDLPGAQVSIDMLEMLQAKTQGNLDPREQKALNDNLSMLRMNYVEAAEAQAAAPSAEGAEAGAKDEAAEAATPPPTEEATADADTDPPPDGGGKPDPRDPKFHKSYG